jgi:transposase
MFQDEARFGRINTPCRCWAPAGCRPEVGTQMVREYIYAYAALSPHDGVLDSLILPEVNADAMGIFLAEVSRRHPDEWIAMYMDRAGWHTAKELHLPHNLCVRHIPPYSPQLNPVEQLWDEMREKWFDNHVFDSLDAVEQTLADALAQLEQTPVQIRKLAGYDWIIRNRLNAT